MKLKAGLVLSTNRHEEFSQKLSEHDCDIVHVDFDDPFWMQADFGSMDFLIYFPSFFGASNRPDSLYRAKDNLQHIHREFPALAMFPDPNLLRFYSDKYLQFLFLHARGFPIPKTIALDQESQIEKISDVLKFPCVVKNRYGAGGDYVFLARSEEKLRDLLGFAKLNFGAFGRKVMLSKQLFRRKFLRGLAGNRTATYPFLSLPLIVQEFIEHDSDLKLVVGDYQVVEGHWRRTSSVDAWKMNIDGGGSGEWSEIPRDVQSLGVRLAKETSAKWINVDLLFKDGLPLISEFSPVWHHYRYREQPSFIYKSNYNLEMSPEESADLAELIVASFCNERPERKDRS